MNDTLDAMTVGLSLVLGSLLAFSPWSLPPRAHAIDGIAEPESAPEDDMGWGDEDEVPPTTEPEPAPQPPAPAPEATPGFNPDGTIIKQPAPPPESRKGIGLLVAAGATGAVAWGVAGARIALINRACVDTGDPAATVLECVRKASNILGLTVILWLANGATYGLSPAAGMVRGRYEAAEHAYSGRYDRNAVAWMAGGGSIMGVGLVTKFALWAMTFSILSCDPAAGDFGECTRRRWTGLFVGHQLASGMIAGGAGALTFGIFYDKERRNREKLYFRPQQVRILPDLGPHSAGLALAGRF